MRIQIDIKGQRTVWPTFFLEAESEEAAIALVHSGQGEGNPIASGISDEEIPFEVKIRAI